MKPRTNRTGRNAMKPQINRTNRTNRINRTSRNTIKPRIQCALTQRMSGFMASGSGLCFMDPPPPSRSAATEPLRGHRAAPRSAAG